MSQLSNLVPHFYTNILSEYPTAIPRGAQWIVLFGSPTAPLQQIGETIKHVIKNYEPGGSEKWSINNSIDRLLNNSNAIESKGCVFAQGVQIPGEGVTTNTLGLQYNGFLRTTGGAGRDPYQGIRVAFLDTNVSFTELFIRPWTITTGHLGLIDNPRIRRVGGGSSTSGPQRIYRTSMTVLKLGTTTTGAGEPVILRTYEFHGVCPISVTDEEYNYSTPTGPVIHETTFIYNWYTVRGPEDSVLGFTPGKVPHSTFIRGQNVTKP